MAVRKTTKRSTDWTTPNKKPEEAKFVGVRPGKYTVFDNSEKTNKALEAKRKMETASRSKKDAKSQKRGLKAANKPLKKTLAGVGATFAASERARAAREAYKQGKGPKLTDAQRIALNRGTILGLPKPPGKLKKMSQTVDRISQQATARAVERKKAQPPKAPKTKSRVRGGRMGGMLGGGSSVTRQPR